MIKLKNILSDILNTYKIEANIITDSKFNISDILNQIRAIRKITIVSVDPMEINKPGLDQIAAGEETEMIAQQKLKQ